MRVIGYLARPLMAPMFILGGLDQLKSPANKAPAAAKLGIPQPTLAVRANGAAMILGGAALALSYKPRRAALLLAATLAPTTYAGHAFWEAEPEAKQMQQIQFLKNSTMLGGLLLAAADAPHNGTPRSARKAAKHVAGAATSTAKETAKAEKKAAREADKAAAKIEAKAQKAADKVEAKAVAKAAKVTARAERKLAKAS